MKLYELARELNLNSMDVLEKAKKLGMQYKSVNNILLEEDLQKLKKELAGVVQPLIVPEHKKGAFIGVVYDGEKFISANIRLTRDDLHRLDHTIIAEHTTIFGAMIEIQKRFTKFINEKTVKIFKVGL